MWVGGSSKCITPNSILGKKKIEFIKGEFSDSEEQFQGAFVRDRELTKNLYPCRSPKL